MRLSAVRLRRLSPSERKAQLLDAREGRAEGKEWPKGSGVEMIFNKTSRFRGGAGSRSQDPAAGLGNFWRMR
jgi:hypothetical protein